MWSLASLNLNAGGKRQADLQHWLLQNAVMYHCEHCFCHVIQIFEGYYAEQ